MIQWNFLSIRKKIKHFVMFCWLIKYAYVETKLILSLTCCKCLVFKFWKIRKSWKKIEIRKFYYQPPALYKLLHNTYSKWNFEYLYSILKSFKFHNEFSYFSILIPRNKIFKFHRRCRIDIFKSDLNNQCRRYL